METKLLLVNSPHESLVLRALHINDDQDLILMGSASFDIYALKRNATEDNIIVPISNNGKQLGKLQIDVKFYPIIPLPEINRGTVQRVPQTSVFECICHWVSLTFSHRCRYRTIGPLSGKRPRPQWPHVCRSLPG